MDTTGPGSENGTARFDPGSCVCEGSALAAMSPNPLQSVVDAVVRRAQRQGFVVPRDVRTELRLAGQAEEHWKAALELARGSLVYRQGRYYHKSAVSPRLEQEQKQQQAIQKVIRGLIRQHRKQIKSQERRGQTRVDFIQPVTVRTEDGKEFQLLSRDLSPTGIRLLGTRRLLGQKVRVDLPEVGGADGCTIVVRVLWTCAVGDDLFENGGTFVELVK